MANLDIWTLLLAASHCAQLASAYWLMASNNILTTQRIDPITHPGTVSTHAHGVIGGSNFGLSLTTQHLQSSQCTSLPIPQDKSNYWYPQLYFEWSNGSFSSVQGNPVIYYLYSDQRGSTTPFPTDFRMLAGDPRLRTYNESDFAQQAVTFLCLNFQGEPTRWNKLPSGICPSGVRAQINFPSCWDGVNVDSSDHRSHVAYLSEGPDKGSCNDTKYPKTLPRIFMEVYWYSQAFDDMRGQAAWPDQPFVFSNGDPLGYSFHGDFFNGWEEGVLQRALDECNCNPYGDPACCVAKGVFEFNQTSKCFITDTVDEPYLGLLESLPGNNPVQTTCFDEFVDEVTPALKAPVYVYSEVSQVVPSATISVAAQTTSLPRPTAQCYRGNALGRGTNSVGAMGLGAFLSTVAYVVNLW